MENNKGLIVSIVVLSIIVGILFIYSMGVTFAYNYNDEQWANDYLDNEEEWCEIFNDYSEVYNEQLEWLIYYDEEIWEGSEQAEMLECYN